MNPDQTGAPTNDETAALQRELEEKQLALGHLGNAPTIERARLQLDIAELLLALERKEEAWSLARPAFDCALQHESWQDAVEACNVLYQCEQPLSIPALGMGTWLSITFPVEPELTFAMLAHIIDETPDHSNGAALAAVTIRYVIDLRASDDIHEDLALLANNIIARVAARHDKVDDQQGLNDWMERLELRDPGVFLPRLSQVVNTIVGASWWFDRDVLRNKLPA